ncbi:unnamed protein product [Boreogadus saida]
MVAVRAAFHRPSLGNPEVMCSSRVCRWYIRQDIRGSISSRVSTYWIYRLDTTAYHLPTIHFKFLFGNMNGKDSLV